MAAIGFLKRGYGIRAFRGCTGLGLLRKCIIGRKGFGATQGQKQCRI